MFLAIAVDNLADTGQGKEKRKSEGTSEEGDESTAAVDVAKSTDGDAFNQFEENEKL